MQDQEEADYLALLNDLERYTGQGCASCSRALCGHEILLSVALGARDAPRCLGCLAQVLERSPIELRDQMTEHFAHRSCYGRAWAVACERENQPVDYRPACLCADQATVSPCTQEMEPSPTRESAIADAWDAGDMGCGDLVLALRIRLNQLSPGSLLQVTARDPAAPLDLPAWCGMTGHTLCRADHPVYLIRRKGG